MREVHLTPKGRERLTEELQRLRGPERKRLHTAIQEAVAQGDLSENAAYESSKREQVLLESRIAYLEERLGRARLLDPRDISTDRVMIGTTITIVNLDTQEEAVYSLLGEEESDHQQGIIAVTTPIARGLVGKKAGEEAVVQVPEGTKRFKIKAIKMYEGLT